jgi:hypothetical protein
MKRLLHFAALCCMLLFPFFSFATTTFHYSLPTYAYRCSGEDTTRITVINSNTSTWTADTLIVYGATGVNYIPSSVTGASEGDVSLLNRPKFILSLLAPGDSITLTFRFRVGCNFVPPPQTGFIFAMKTGTGIDSLNTSLITIRSSALSISTSHISPSSVTMNVGDTLCRTIQVQNNGTAPVDSFLITEAHNPSLRVYLVDSAIWHARSDHGLDSFIINHSLITPFYPSGSIPDTGSITFRECMILLDCHGDAGRAYSDQSTFNLYLPCSDACMQSSATAQVNIAHGLPNVIISNKCDTMICYDTLHRQIDMLYVKNLGTGRAGNVYVTLDNSSSAYESDLTLDSFRIIMPGGSSYSLSDTTLRSSVSYLSSHKCFSRSIDKLRFYLPGFLNAGETAKIIIRVSHCSLAASGCRSKATNGINYYGKYTSSCGDSLLIPSSYTQPSASTGWSHRYIGTSDMADHEIDTICFDNTSLLHIVPGDSSTMQIIMTLALDSGLYFLPGQVFFESSGVPVLSPLSVRTVSDSGGSQQEYTVVTYPYSSLFTAAYNTSTCFGIQARCPAPPVSYINLHVYENPSTTCVQPAQTVSCAGSFANVHCPGCTKQGIHFLGYKINRINFGKPDNNNDGKPDTGSINMHCVRTDLATLGDTLQSLITSKVIINDNYNPWPFADTFRYFYYEAIIGGGANLKVVSSTIKIFDRTDTAGTDITSYTVTIPGDSATTHSGTFVNYDYSLDVLQRFGLSSAYTHFGNNDSVTVTNTYVVDSMVSCSGETECDVQNKIYLGIIPHPTCDAESCLPVSFDSTRTGVVECSDTLPRCNSNVQYYCTKFGGRFYLIGGCASVTDQFEKSTDCLYRLQLNYYFNMENPSTQINNFPCEYRSWLVPGLIRVRIPDGYTGDSVIIQTTAAYPGGSTFVIHLSHADGDSASWRTLNLSNYLTDSAALISSTRQYRPDDSYLLQVTFLLYPSCSTPETAQIKPYTFNYTQPQSWLALLPDTITHSGTDSSYFHPPVLVPNVVSYTVEGVSDTVCWSFYLENNSNITCSRNTWISLSAAGGHIHITRASVGGVPATIDTSGMVHVGLISTEDSTLVQLCGTYSCDTILDSLRVFYGWDCHGYPSNLAAYPCDAASFNLLVNPKLAALQADSNLTTTPWHPCSIVPFQTHIISTGEGILYDPIVRVTLPSGTSLLTGSDTLFYSGHTYPVTRRTISGDTVTWYLDSICAPIAAAGLPCASCGSTYSNSAILRFKIKVGCAISSLDTLLLNYKARTNCNQQISFNFSDPIPIIDTNCSHSSRANLNITTTNAYACDTSVCLRLVIHNTGATKLNNLDTLQYSFPKTLHLASLTSDAHMGAGHTVTTSSSLSSITIPVSLINSGDSAIVNFCLHLDSTACTAQNISAILNLRDTCSCAVTGTLCQDMSHSETAALSITFSSPSSAFAPASPICPGSSVHLYAGACGYSTWHVSDGYNSSLDSSNHAIINPGTYVVTYTGLACSKRIDSFTVVVQKPNALITPADTTVCEGSLVRLHGTGGTLSWSPADSVRPYTNTVVTLTVTDGLGCKDTTRDTVKVWPPIRISAGADIGICYGDTDHLLGHFISDTGTVLWSPSTGLNSSTILKPISTTHINQSYIITATNIHGCQHKDTTNVTVYPGINVHPNVYTNSRVACTSDTSIHNVMLPIASDSCIDVCGHSLAKYWTRGVDTASSFSWSVTGAESVTLRGVHTDTALIYWNNIDSTHHIYISETTAHGCHSSVAICINIHKNSYAHIRVPLDSVRHDTAYVCLLSPLTFDDSTSVGSNGRFYFDDGSAPLTISTVAPPAHRFDHSFYTRGWHWIKLEERNECGCLDSMRLWVYVDSFRGPNILCHSVVCFGDSVRYISDDTCTSYNWTVVGGHILSARPYNNIIDIRWDSAYAGYGSITLSGSTCFARCAYPVHIPIYIVPPVDSIRITGSDTVLCEGDILHLISPSIPGMTYSWSITSATVLSPCTDAQDLYIQAGSDTDITVKVTFDHTLAHCGGTRTIHIKVHRKFSISGATTVCAKSSVRYYSSPNTTGLNWTLVRPDSTISLGTDSSVRVDFPNRAGTYILYASNASRCQSSLRITVLDSIANPTGISGTDTVCNLMPYTYVALGSHTTSSAHWVQSLASTSTSTGDSTTLIWRFLTSGSTTLGVFNVGRISPYCKSDTIRKNIYLMHPKVVIHGADSTCTNAFANYTATSQDAETYSWTIEPATIGSVGGDPHSSSVRILWNDTVTAVRAKITVKARICGVTVADSMHVWVMPTRPVSIISPDTICQNGTLNFRADSNLTASYYSWNFCGSTLGTTLNTWQTATLSSAGYCTLALTVTNPSGCPMTAIANKRVFVKASPITTLTSPDMVHYCDSAVHSRIDVTVLSPLYYTFQFFRNGVALGAAGTSAEYLATQTGSYQCYLYDTAGCSIWTNTLVIDSCSIPHGGGTSGCNHISHAVAAYSIDTSTCGLVTLRDNTTGVIDSRYWYIFTGTSFVSRSTAITTYQFSTAGAYIVYDIVNFRDTVNACTYADTAILYISIPLIAQGTWSLQCDTTGHHVLRYNDLSNYIPGHSITSRLWAYDDTSWLGSRGGTYTLYNQRDSARIHFVALTVSDGTNSCVVHSTLNVPVHLQAAFIDSGATCEGEPIHFYDRSTPASFIKQWDWDFGDGASVLGVTNPIRTYNLITGTTTLPVELKVTDSLGCWNNYTLSVIVAANNLAGNLSAPPDNCLGNYDTIAYLPTGGSTAPASYYWSDHSIASRLIVGSSGYYGATVSDANGCIIVPNYASVLLYGLPQAQILSHGIYCSNNTVTIDALNDSSYRFLWRIDHDSFTTSPQYEISRSLNSGMHNAAVWVTETHGSLICKTSTVDTFKVGKAPVFTLDSVMLCSDSTNPRRIFIRKDSLVTGTYSVLWNNGSARDTVYMPSGGYATCWVSDTFGCTTMKSKFISPPVDFSLFPTGCLTVCDNGSGATIDGLPCSFSQWRWLREGGILSSGTGVVTPLNTVLNGHYQLSVKDGSGCWETSPPMEVDVVACKLCGSGKLTGITVACDTSNSTYLKVAFKITQTTFSSGVVRYFIESPEANIPHPYDSGMITSFPTTALIGTRIQRIVPEDSAVTLRIVIKKYNSSGVATDSCVITVTLSSLPCCGCDLHARFSYSSCVDTCVFTPRSLYFGCTVPPFSGNTVQWHFGDGSAWMASTATGSVTHVYPGIGTYNVCLAISGIGGIRIPPSTFTHCLDTICGTVTITNDCSSFHGGGANRIGFFGDESEKELLSLVMSDKLQLFPNPVEDKLNIIWQGHMIQEEQIITPLGNIVWKEGMAGVDRNIVDVSTFSGGYYLIILKDQNGKTTQGSWVKP